MSALVCHPVPTGSDHATSPFCDILDGFVTVVLAAGTHSAVAEFIHANASVLMSACSEISVVDEPAERRFRAVMDYDLWGTAPCITVPGFNPLDSGEAFILLSVDVDFILDVRDAARRWEEKEGTVAWLTAFPRNTLAVRGAMRVPSVRFTLLEDVAWIDDTHASNTMDYLFTLHYEEKHPLYRFLETLLSHIRPGHDLDWGVAEVGPAFRYWVAVRCDVSTGVADDTALFLQALVQATQPTAVGLGLSAMWRRGDFFGVDNDKSLASLVTNN